MVGSSGTAAVAGDVVAELAGDAVAVSDVTAGVELVCRARIRRNSVSPAKTTTTISSTDRRARVTSAATLITC